MVFAQGINPDSLPVWRGYESVAEVIELKDTAEKKENLQTKGSKSFQTSIGDGGADIQQELRLSIQGEVADGVFIDAYLVDLGRPAGTEVTTTLRETDAAYIGIESKRMKLELGDLNYEINRNMLWELNRKTLGAGGKLKGDNAEVGAIYGTDKTERQSITFYGQPSQQKGYLLFSDSVFGLIAPHTEKVYLNGILLSSGKDYEINYAGGVLDFLGRIIPGPEDEIRVEYDSYSSLNSSELRGAEAAYRSRFVWLDIAAFNLRDSLKSDKMLGTRLRAGNSLLFSDLEMAMNEQENKAYRWVFESDSNSRQKSFFKVSVKGGYADSGFAKPEYSGSENAWDSFILRDKWLLESVPQGNLRYDEVRTAMRLPYGFFPGFFIGHRNFESVRGEGFLRRETENAESEALLANINNSLWQGEIKSKFLRGNYRPYANFRMDSEENLRSISGLEWGNENAGKYASTEFMREQTDTSGFSNWKTFVFLREKIWHSGTLFQIRNDDKLGEDKGEHLSFLLDQNAGYSNPNSALRGEAFYSFNYTNEVPWVAIYRKVPDGAGDVYYDSLSGQYISGVDNGNFVYEGMGRADSLANRNYRNNLRWNLSMHPVIFIKRGFLSDMTFFANGEWLLHKTEKLLLLENSALWEHPKNKGSLMFTVNNKWNKEPQINFEEVLFSQEAKASYRGRQKEDFSLRLKREEAEFSLSELSWLSYEGELAWLRELGKGFSLSPFYSRKFTDGSYVQESWNTLLQKGGINGKWQSEKGDLAQLGISGNYVEKSSDISPYSAVDGFEKGFSWRSSAMAQMAFGKNFFLSGQYVIRIWQETVIQKLSMEAKAVF
ncbi:MAG: hypothetical protein FWH22_04025 [Fibromonadales bacterium]|nr:hypothetical protein [Fibromonadales bacterium]